jgi:hypothetical protein
MGRERTVLLPSLEGKYTHQTRKGQLQMHRGVINHDEETDCHSNRTREISSAS